MDRITHVRCEMHLCFFMTTKFFFSLCLSYISLLPFCEFFFNTIHPCAAMSLSNTLNMPDACLLLDFGLMDNHSSLCQDATSSSTSFFDGTLLSSANILISTMRTPSTLTRLEGHESGTYVQLWHQYQKCKQRTSFS
jgi:hypothetical protein